MTPPVAGPPVRIEDAGNAASRKTPSHRIFNRTFISLYIMRKQKDQTNQTLRNNVICVA